MKTANEGDEDDEADEDEGEGEGESDDCEEVLARVDEDDGDKREDSSRVPEAGGVSARRLPVLLRTALARRVAEDSIVRVLAYLLFLH